MLQKTGSSPGGFLTDFNNRARVRVYLRPKHIGAGLALFAGGLFLAFLNILYVVEFLKGLAQPILLGVGLTALAAGIFSTQKTMKMVNLVIGVGCTAIGCYGVYDEYYATVDFIRGLLPPLLIVGGLTALIHGISQIKQK